MKRFQSVRGEIETARLQSILATIGMGMTAIGNGDGGPDTYERGWLRSEKDVNRDIRECWRRLTEAQQLVRVEIDRIEREAKETEVTI